MVGQRDVDLTGAHGLEHADVAGLVVLGLQGLHALDPGAGLLLALLRDHHAQEVLEAGVADGPADAALEAGHLGEVHDRVGQLIRLDLGRVVRQRAEADGGGQPGAAVGQVVVTDVAGQGGAQLAELAFLGQFAQRAHRVAPVHVGGAAAAFLAQGGDELRVGAVADVDLDARLPFELLHDRVHEGLGAAGVHGQGLGLREAGAGEQQGGDGEQGAFHPLNPK